jgi:hypothetical protein
MTQPKDSHVAPEDQVAFEHANFVIEIVRQIMREKRDDNFDTCTFLIGIAAALAHADPAHRTAIACHLIRTALELDPDCGVVRWQ